MYCLGAGWRAANNVLKLDEPLFTQALQVQVLRLPVLGVQWDIYRHTNTDLRR
jgi:DNA primase